MIVKNKLFKLSSLCVLGSVVVIVNHFLPSSSTSYNESNQGDVNSGYSLEVSDDNSTINLVEGDKSDVATAIEDNKVPTIATPAPTKTVEDEKDDPNAIPGINYKDYIDMSKYKNLGIAKVEKYLNVRKSANTSSTVVAKMPPNAGCTIKEETKNSKGEVWCHIISGEVEGYVMKDFLVTGDEALGMVNDVGSIVIIVDCDVLNVRKKATTDSSTLYQISKGEKLEVVSVTKDWIEVNVDISEDTGFVARDYVNISFALKEAISIDELLVGCSTERVKLVSYAKEFLGNPYVYGGYNLYTGIDCSGFTKKIYANSGYTLHRSSREQAAYDGVTIKKSQLQPGDLVFYAQGGTVHHVAIYIGNGQIVHASTPRSGIKISNMNYTTPYKYKRIFTK